MRGEVPDGEHIVPLGLAAVRRPGTDVTILSYSQMVYRCLEAAEQLAEIGISAEVIDLRSLVEDGKLVGAITRFDILRVIRANLTSMVESR
jgi:pyruvate/2-oxoglutarate/acetoin dehydrogenase E1 component